MMTTCRRKNCLQEQKGTTESEAEAIASAAVRTLRKGQRPADEERAASLTQGAGSVVLSVASESTAWSVLSESEVWSTVGDTPSECESWDVIGESEVCIEVNEAAEWTGIQAGRRRSMRNRRAQPAGVSSACAGEELLATAGTEIRSGTVGALCPGDVFLMPTSWRKFNMATSSLTLGGFVPCRVMASIHRQFCCKGPRNWRLVKGQSLLDGSFIYGMEHKNTDYWAAADWEVKEFVLLDLDEEFGSVSLFDELKGEVREDLNLPKDVPRAVPKALAPERCPASCAGMCCIGKFGTDNVAAVRSELVAAFRSEKHLVVAVSSLCGVEGILGFREEATGANWRTWAGDVDMEQLRAGIARQKKG